jgi:hypothetical protein
MPLFWFFRQESGHSVWLLHAHSLRHGFLPIDAQNIRKKARLNHVPQAMWHAGRKCDITFLIGWLETFAVQNGSINKNVAGVRLPLGRV